MKKTFAPGCALMLYKPHLAEKIYSILNNNMEDMEMHMTCCKHEPRFTQQTEVINICPGCDKRYSNDYENTTTLSLWELFAQSDFFPFPDYNGITMTINDACPVRDKEPVHNAIRILLKKMNINLVEPERTRNKSICCGDSFYGMIPVDEVKAQMLKRASELPLNDVVVYCVSCIKSVFIGGKKPHHLVDLLFNEETVPQTYDPDMWHKEIDEYISKH